MAIKTQGSTLYALIPVNCWRPNCHREVVEIGCIKDFEGGGNPADQIETTCLNEDYALHGWIENPRVHNIQYSTLIRKMK